LGGPNPNVFCILIEKTESHVLGVHLHCGTLVEKTGKTLRF